MIALMDGDNFSENTMTQTLLGVILVGRRRGAAARANAPTAATKPALPE